MLFRYILEIDAVRRGTGLLKSKEMLKREFDTMVRWRSEFVSCQSNKTNCAHIRGRYCSWPSSRQMNVSVSFSPSIWVKWFCIKSPRALVEEKFALIIISYRPEVKKTRLISGRFDNASMAAPNFVGTTSRAIMTDRGKPNFLALTTPIIRIEPLLISLFILRLTVAELNLSCLANLSLFWRAFLLNSRAIFISIESGAVILF